MKCILSCANAGIWSVCTNDYSCRHLVRIHSACYQLFSFAFSFDQQKPEDRPSFTALYGELDNLG